MTDPRCLGRREPSGMWKGTLGDGLWPCGALCLRSGVKPRDHGKQLDVFDEGCDISYTVLRYSFRKIIADIQCSSVDDMSYSK